VGPFLAEELDLPCATLIANGDPENGDLRLRRPTEAGYDILEAPLPFLATVTNDETNVPRYASVRGILAARKAEIPVWSAEDLGLDPAEFAPEEAQIVLDELFIPETEVRCEFIEGETGSEKAKKLVEYLKDEKVI
jgi:electron transfer flavoprotein beta subunit